MSTFTPSGYDYSAITPDVQNVAFNAASRIRQHMRATTGAILSIGAELLRVKEVLDHGEFGKWIAKEFEFDERSARRYMQTARAFFGKTDTVSDLQPTTLYMLAAPSTPEPVREEILQRREAGDRLGDVAVQSLVKEGRQKHERSDRRRQNREAREKRRSPAYQEREEKRRAKEEEARLRRDQVERELLNLIRERLGDDLREVLRRMEEADIGALWFSRRALEDGEP